MKVAARIYKGIEFVGVEELSARQQLALKENKTVERIKILIEGKVVSNCIQYKHYVNWYAATFEKGNGSTTVQTVTPQERSVMLGTH